jgi:cell division protein FtsL
VASRRVSGPVRPRQRGQRLVPLSERAVAFIRTLPDHALVDRVVRGRTWIALLGVMLAGIVAMQVELLKLNASIGRSIQLGVALQSRNDNLRASVSSLSDAQRIERLASGMGMVMAGPTSVQFLDARHVSGAKAAANIHSPDTASFQAALQAMLSAATQSSSGPGGTAVGPTAAPQAAAPGTGTPAQAPTATAGAPTTGAVAPTTPATPPTTAPTAPATPPTHVAPTGAAAGPTAAGTSGSQSIR